LVQALVGAGSRGPTGGLHLDDLQALRRRKAPARKGLERDSYLGSGSSSLLHVTRALAADLRPVVIQLGRSSAWPPPSSRPPHVDARGGRERVVEIKLTGQLRPEVWTAFPGSSLRARGSRPERTWAWRGWGRGWSRPQTCERPTSPPTATCRRCARRIRRPPESRWIHRSPTLRRGRPVPKFLSISWPSCPVTSASPRPESPGRLGSPTP